jgi:hypothetical protein
MYNIQEIFKQFGNVYLDKYNPSLCQRRVFNKILNCRTDKLGTRIYKCNSCGKQVFTYNSCKDRHCPNCQNYQKEVWINNHKEDILNITYFHVVLTVPKELHPIFYHNQKLMYNLLFDIGCNTILKLCEDKLKIKVGIMAMLHTWSQKGNYYPHLHLIVTGGGLDKLNKWKDSKKLLPVKVISKTFRNNLLKGIKEQDLTFYNDYEYLNDKENLNNYLDNLSKRYFIVYSKTPFNDVNDLIKYLGKYAFRVCMTNERIEKIEKGYVYFNYKDRSNNNSKKIEKIKGEEFIRKFLMHTLPKSFIKIRYYGLMAGRDKKTRLNKLKILTKTKTIINNFKSKIELLNKMLDKDITKCSNCNGNLELYIYKTSNKSPPQDKIEEKKYA